MLCGQYRPKGSRKPHHFDPEFGFVKFYPNATLNQSWRFASTREVAASGRRGGCSESSPTHPGTAAVAPGAKNRILAITTHRSSESIAENARGARVPPRWGGRDPIFSVFDSSLPHERSTPGTY